MNAAQIFAALHAGPELFILPNAWDAGSARVIEKAGAKAIATSSAAVGWAHGYPDGQALPFEILLASLREIIRVVEIPVSADIEAAYAQTAQAAGETVKRIEDAGAVGINIEDGKDAPDLLCAKIERIKQVSSVWVNARTDVYLHKLAEGEAAYAESVRRAKAYRDAGADSIFVPMAVEEKTVARLVEAISAPLNLLAWPGLPPAATLQKLGVRRLSAGSGVAKASLNRTYALAQAFLAEGRSEPLTEPLLMPGGLNAMMRRG
jgi:2-methylisocitrate lyase-like PEP mutase family enzyme